MCAACPARGRKLGGPWWRAGKCHRGIKEDAAGCREGRMAKEFGAKGRRAHGRALQRAQGATPGAEQPCRAHEKSRSKFGVQTR